MKLEDVIREYIILPSTHNGWYKVLCPVCGDRGNKGLRAGFNFQNDVTVYNCFNCDAGCSYDPSSYPLVSKKMQIVLDSFLIPTEAWKQVEFNNFGLNPIKQIKVAPEHKDPTPFTLPDHWYPLIPDDNDKWSLIAIDHLNEERMMEYNDYPFYLSKDKDWKGRLLMPIFDRKGAVIFYQGRDLTRKATLKYKSCEVPRTNIIYGGMELYKHSDKPLYILEGMFDAWHVGGVATFSNKLTEYHIHVLNKSPRRKVLIPDMMGDGHVAAEQALRNGWEISIPDMGQCKDITEGVKKYGKLYMLQTVIDNIKSGFEAEVHIQTLK